MINAKITWSSENGDVHGSHQLECWVASAEKVPTVEVSLGYIGERRMDISVDLSGLIEDLRLKGLI